MKKACAAAPCAGKGAMDCIKHFFNDAAAATRAANALMRAGNALSCASFRLTEGGTARCDALKKPYCLEEDAPCPFHTEKPGAA